MAKSLYAEALQRSRGIWGNLDLKTLNSVNDLAGHYITQKQYTKAFPLLEEALLYSRAGLGESHPHTLKTLATLALLYKSQGQHGKSLALYDEVMKRDRSFPGAYKPSPLSNEQILRISPTDRNGLASRANER